jgi:formate hydrogenlyase subunit 3/multisubunit Na+/H+ antiporter MnhD subunit
MPGVVTLPAAQLLGALGAAAILFGSIVALRQERLKLLIAYSTLAQIGYLFLMFPLAFDTATGQLEAGGALEGGLLQAISHATAKAAMFMAAGSIYAALGHDRIAGLAGVARALPVSVLAFALGGIALMGVVPSGAYLAKKLLLDAADVTGQSWLAFVLQGGGVFTCGYVVLVLVHALRPAPAALPVRAVPRLAQYASLALALCSLLLAGAAFGPLPRSLISNPFAPAELMSLLLVFAGGGVLAWALGARAPSSAGPGSVRRGALAVASVFVRTDNVLRYWPVAGLSLLIVALLFGAALRSG